MALLGEDSTPSSKNYPEAYDYYMNVKSKYPNITDPDSESEILQIIFKMIWNEDVLRCCYDVEKKRIKGDTMNTIQPSLGVYLRRIHNERYQRGDAGFKEYYYGSLNQSLQLYLELDKDEKKLIKDKAVTDFIKIYHSLGNFMPVPYSKNGGEFNIARSSAVNDYWDATMWCIYNWYVTGKNKKDNADRWLFKLLKELENVELCKNWLKNFKTWNQFVDDNYLQPFVDENYKPILLFGTDFEDRKKPVSEEECMEYFEKTYDCVMKRSKLMVGAIRKKFKALLH